MEFLDNLQSTDVGTNNTCKEPNYEDKDVLDGSVDKVQLGIVRVPMSGRVYNRGGHQGEGGHLDGSQQRHQQLQPGHCGCQPNCEDDINKITIQPLLTCEEIEKDPGEELGVGIRPVGHYGLENVWSDDVHDNIELEGVGEEDGHTEH